MATNCLFKVRLSGFLAATCVVLLSMIGDVIAQQFPIGTYWVRTNRERYDQYPQVADCGININVGGNYGTSQILWMLQTQKTSP